MFFVANWKEVISLWYEINVAFEGSHFFATHERSIDRQEVACNLLKVFRRKFKAEDGYSITVKRYSTVGCDVTTELLALG